MGGIGRFQKKASVAKATGTDSVGSGNIPALMNDKTQNSNSTLLHSGEFEILELPNPTLTIHFDSNFRARSVGEQSSPDTRLSACQFGMFHRLNNSLEGSLQNELLNEKQASCYEEEQEGNLYAKISGKTTYERKEQEEISPGHESTTAKNDTALENSEENVNKSAKTNTTIESLIDETEHACNPVDPKEKLRVHKQSTDVLNVMDIDKLVDPENATHDITGFSTTAHCKDALCVPDDFSIIPDQQSLVDEIDARSSGQSQRNGIPMKQADQWQKLNCELTSIDSKGTFSQPDASKLPSGGSISSEIMYISTSKHCKGLAAKNLQNHQKSSFIEFGHSNLARHSDQTTQAAPANMVSASSGYNALPSFMDKEKMRESLVKKSSIQPVLLLKSTLGPSRPVLTSAASKKAQTSFKNDAPMESESKLSRPIMETNLVDLIKQSKKNDGLLTLCNTNNRQDMELVPPPVEISPRLIITSSSKSLLHSHHPNNLKEVVDSSSNTPANTDSNTSSASPQVISTSSQHCEDVSKPGHDEVSTLVPVATTVSPIATANFMKHDEYNQAESSSRGRELFDCLLTKFLMNIRDVQDSLDVSGTEILDAEITFAEIYNQALDMQGRMIDSIEEIDAAMRCAEKSIESTKEWV